MEISVPSEFLGKQIIDLSVTRSCKGLIDSWSALLVSDTAPAAIGEDVSLSGHFAGVVTATRNMYNGSWLVEGNGNGRKLMKSTPSQETLSAGSIGSLISQLATYCDVSVASLSVSSPDVEDCRTLLMGGTCGEALALLCRLGGSIAYFNTSGNLVIAPPSSFIAPSGNILSVEGDALDTDGYATGVFCTVHCQGDEPVPISSVPSSGTAGTWVGTTLDGDLTEETQDGITLLMPLGLVTAVSVSGQDFLGDHTGPWSVNETYTYETETEVVEENGVEYRVFRYRLTARTKVSVFSWVVGEDTFTKTTTETFSRTYTTIEDVDKLSEEELTISTVTSPAPVSSISDPPYDKHVEIKYSYSNNARIARKYETTYTLKETGSTITVTDEEGEILSDTEDPLLLATARKMAFVPTEKQTLTMETIGDDGECVLRVVSQAEDNETLWAQAEEKLPTLDPENPLYQDIRGQILSSPTSQIDAYPGSFSISAETWNEKRFAGRRYVGGSSASGSGPSVPTTGNCPYFDDETGDCKVYGVSGSGEDCYLADGLTPPEGWLTCARYEYMATTTADAYSSGVLAPPVVDYVGGGKIWADISVYFDEELSSSQAKTIARNLASNVLSLAQTGKGIVRTVTIPLDTSIMPTGECISVTHNYKSLTTSVSYLLDDTIPEHMIFSKTSTLVSAMQQNNVMGQELPGIVLKIVSRDKISVQVRGRSILCRSRVGNIGAGNAVLVYLPPGSDGYGVIRDVL